MAFVTTDDQLNVRSGPGVEYDILTSLAPDRGELLITGPGQEVSGSIWVPIQSEGIAGWVNGRYLTSQDLDPDFCQNPEVIDLLAQFESAIANQDNQSLQALIHPIRGLKVRTYWWNPEVHIVGDELEGLFTNNQDYNWGIEDGSGNPISGTFGQVILPQLQQDFLGAGEKACNEILAGPTAGIITLPDGYQNVQFFSYQRSASDELGFDWGTWVVGIESWQSEVYLSYLVHYNYEI